MSIKNNCLCYTDGKMLSILPIDGEYTDRAFLIKDAMECNKEIFKHTLKGDFEYSDIEPFTKDFVGNYPAIERVVPTEDDITYSQFIPNVKAVTVFGEFRFVPAKGNRSSIMFQLYSKQYREHIFKGYLVLTKPLEYVEYVYKPIWEVK